MKEQEEHQILPKKQDSQYPEISYFQLFRFANRNEKILMFIGGLCAFINGATFPCFSIIYGKMVYSFSFEGTDIVEQAGRNAIYFAIIGVGTFFLSIIMFGTWMITGERQGIEIRRQYFNSIMQQDVEWFETINPNQLNNKVAKESFDIQNAIGEKTATLLMTVSWTFFGFFIGFLYGWKLALVVTASLPGLSVFTGIVTFVVHRSEQQTSKAYSDAGGHAEQAIIGIRTVKILDGEEFEFKKYSECLIKAAKVAIKYNFGIGTGFGLIFGGMIWSYALGFWYGAKLIADQSYNINTDSVYNIQDVMIIFYAVLNGGYAIGQIGPLLQYFAKGKAAGQQMFAVLDRVPKIQNSINPISLDKFDGSITFKNVSFSYPSKPDVKILDGLSFTIPKGKKVALVGESGCGKSTIIQLIERFYDCDEGEVILGENDGHNIKNVDLVQLRQKIGLVSQEPVLLATSIRENLKFSNPNASEEEIIDALQKAYAWDFIKSMEKGLDTYVGIGGQHLSGGQKQRIAIARAILKKPQVLLLDEATSALDRKNEKLIQNTIDKVTKGITTIIIAHRLKTIQEADIIYVLEKGKIKNFGSHDELMERCSLYQGYVEKQMQKKGQDLNSAQVTPIESFAIDSKNIVRSSDNVQYVSVENENDQLRQQDKYSCEVMNSAKVTNALLPEIRDTLYRAPQKTQNKNTSVVARLFEYNKEERLYLILGIIAAIINGCTMPVFSLMFSRIMTILVILSGYNAGPQQFEDANDEKNQICLWFFLIGLATVLLWGIQMIFLAIVGENLTLKIRQMTFRKILRMPISFFDQPKNSPSSLSNILSVDCKHIQGLTSSILGIHLQNAGALIAGFTIAFYSSWQLALVILALQPLTFFGQILQAKFVKGFSDLTDDSYKESMNIISESVTNIKTIQAFGNNQQILKTYLSYLSKPLIRAKKNALQAGIAFGISQMTTFINYSIQFYVGALLVVHEGVSAESMFRTIFAVSFATLGAGNNQVLIGDSNIAKKAAENIFQLLDSEDEYQREVRMGRKRVTKPIVGNIQFKNVSFKYETRDKKILNGINLNIKSGDKIALVGQSGCGKTTIMQLLMRFYDPDGGQILVDNIDIRDYDLRYFRQQMAIVSQEPVLFQGSIKQNIKYNLQNITDEQIHQAAKQANAYDFITQNDISQESSGSGFDRQVGQKGSQISGGQKQRIAIARAILRKCNIMLLDEATSALDSQSETLVQQALDKLMQEKTTLSIAHRLSTIQDSNVIFVLEDGRVVEEGTYDQLMSFQGAFFQIERGLQK